MFFLARFAAASRIHICEYALRADPLPLFNALNLLRILPQWQPTLSFTNLLHWKFVFGFNFSSSFFTRRRATSPNRIPTPTTVCIALGAVSLFPRLSSGSDHSTSQEGFIFDSTRFDPPFRMQLCIILEFSSFSRAVFLFSFFSRLHLVLFACMLSAHL